MIINTVMMSLADEKPLVTTTQTCKSHDYDTMKPIVLATWKHSFQGGCPDKSAILAESQVCEESVIGLLALVMNQVDVGVDFCRWCRKVLEYLEQG